jgi:hypothetical protein
MSRVGLAVEPLRHMLDWQLNLRHVSSRHMLDWQLIPTRHAMTPYRCPTRDIMVW